MQESDFQLLIKEYLRKKGYTEAEQAFTRDAGSIPKAHDMLSNRLDIHRGVVENLVQHFTADGGGAPQSHADAYDKLVNWVDNALDIYRGDLSRVLYPAFLHTFLGLVERNSMAVANAFLHKYRRRMADSYVRPQQLQELQNLLMGGGQGGGTGGTGRAAECARVMKQLSSTKHRVTMTAHCQGLLLHFLHTTPAMLSIGLVVSQHIAFQTAEGLPGDVAPDEGLNDAADGEEGMGGDAYATNQTSVQLGLLEGNVEDIFEDEQVKQGVMAERPSEQEAGGEEGAAAKKSKKASASAAKPIIKMRRERPERVIPLPFVPPLDEDVVKELVQDIEFRSEVSPSTLPSCCFFTFVNTKQTLACAAFTGDVRMVAAGFADSSIRLYDVQQLSKANSKRIRKLQKGGAAQAARDDEEEEEDFDQPKLKWQALPASASAPPASNSTAQAPSSSSGPRSPAVVQLHGHSAPVYSLDFSHNSRLLASSSGDGTVRLWSPELGAGLAYLGGHTMPVWDVSWCPQGWLLASASSDRTARIWATDASRCLRLLVGHTSDVDIVRWHPNCHYVATASSDRSVRLWDVSTGDCVRLMTVPAGLKAKGSAAGGVGSSYTSLAMSPDGKQVACGSEDGSIHVWDLSNAKHLCAMTGHRGPVWSLAYSGGLGSLLASGGADETVRLWTNHSGSSGDSLGAVPEEGKPGKDGGASTALSIFAPLESYSTKSSPAVSLSFSNRNLLLAAGAFSLRV